MESAPNELSDFGDEDLVKCGEIVLSKKQNAFAFTCIQCKEIFSQMVIFARHVRLEHQVEAEVIEQYKQELQELSVYTVEELLSDEDESGLSCANTSIDEGQVNKAVARSPHPDSDDTGIDSDEELEKEISALLANIATSDSHSLTGTEFSDDSGLDSKNITDENRSQSQEEDQSNICAKETNKVNAEHSTELEEKRESTFNGEEGTNIKDEQGTKANGKLESKSANMRTRSTTTALRTGSKTDLTPQTKNTKTKTLKENNLNLQFQKQENDSIDDQKYMNYAKPSTKKATDNLEHKNKVKSNPTNFIKNQTKDVKRIRKRSDVAEVAPKKIKMVVKSIAAKTEELNKKLEIDFNDELSINDFNYEEELNKELDINLNNVEGVNDAKGDELDSALEVSLNNDSECINDVIEELHKELNIDVNAEPECITTAKCEGIHKEMAIDVNDEVERITSAECEELDIDVNAEAECITTAKCEGIHKELDIDVNDEVERITFAECEELHEELDIDVNAEAECITTAKCEGIHKELDIDVNDEVERITSAECEELHKELDVDVNDEVARIITAKSDEVHKQLDIGVHDDVACIVNANFDELHKQLDIDVNDGVTRISDAKSEEFHKELYIYLNDDLGSPTKCEEMNTELECARECVEEPNVPDGELRDVRDFENTNTSPIVARSELNETDQPFVIVGMDDELAGIKFSKEEIDVMKAGLPEVPTYNFEQPDKNNELEKTASINGLSAFQMQYVVYNETKAQLSADINADDDKSITSAETDGTDVVAPLDLSLNKSVDFAEIQTEEISELLPNDPQQCKITSDILPEVENFLEQQDTTTTFNNDNPTSAYESHELLTFDSMDNNRQLPPFSKFFKNTANCLRTSNACFAQSTPKQKPVKATNEKQQTKVASPLRPSAQLNMTAKHGDAPKCKENVNTVKYLGEKLVCKKSIKYSLAKRVSVNNEKENNTKKRKIDNEGVKKKHIEGLEILSVQVLPPNATIADKEKIEELENAKLPFIKEETNNIKWEPISLENIEEDLIPFVKIKKSSGTCSSHAVADSTSEKCITSFSELNYSPEDTLNQLKLEPLVDEKPLCYSLSRNNLSFVDVSNGSHMASLIEENSFLNEASEEEKENYLLLQPLGLQVIVDPNVEDGMNLNTLETTRANASVFAKMYIDFKYLWKVGRGMKNYEELELDFNKLMQRINDHYKLELTISETKRIVNLISLWYMQSYSKSLIKKKPILESVNHYLQLFTYLPKAARRIFYCEECPRYFLSQQNYLLHRGKHLALPSTCPYCQINYCNRKELLQHTKICTTFTCMECNCKFDNAADLEYHLRNEHLGQCETCGRLTATAIELQTHEHLNPIICALCNRLFDTAAELQKHRQDSFHWDYTCHKCDVFLPTATQMKHHSMLCKTGASK